MCQVIHIEEIYRPLPRSKVQRSNLCDELQPLDWWLGPNSKPGQINDDVVRLVYSVWVHHSLLDLSATQMLYEGFTDPEDVVHEQLHVYCVCLDLGGKKDEHRNVFFL